MKFKFQYFLSLSLVIICQLVYGQEDRYQYLRPIENVTEHWHKISLPDPIFEKVQKDFSDIRIIGITHNQDTIEMPYLLNILNDEIEKKDVAFKMLNESNKGSNYVFFLEIPSRAEINRITLSFQEKNFDWKVSLAGSQKPDDFYNIMEDYRIVSVNNQWTNYSFKTLIFPKSLYRYYKITIEADKKPHLLSAHVEQEQIIPGSYKSYSLTSRDIKNNKKQKETIIDLSLSLAVPVSNFQIKIDDSIDYYRPIRIQYLADSAHSPQGWKYHYRTVYEGILSSLEKKEFTIRDIIASRWRLIISNKDNAPLNYGEIEIKGSEHELIARFSEPAAYYLMYGNPKASSPSYDIQNFQEKIPNKLIKLEPGHEQVIFMEEIVHAIPLFQNQFWLWGLMVIIMIVLGIFSLKMIRKVN